MLPFCLSLMALQLQRTAVLSPLRLVMQVLKLSCGLGGCNLHAVCMILLVMISARMVVASRKCYWLGGTKVSLSSAYPQ